MNIDKGKFERKSERERKNAHMHTIFASNHMQLNRYYYYYEFFFCVLLVVLFLCIVFALFSYTNATGVVERMMLNYFPQGSNFNSTDHWTLPEFIGVHFFAYKLMSELIWISFNFFFVSLAFIKFIWAPHVTLIEIGFLVYAYVVFYNWSPCFIFFTKKKKNDAIFHYFISQHSHCLFYTSSKSWSWQSIFHYSRTIAIYCIHIYIFLHREREWTRMSQDESMVYAPYDQPQ